MGGHSEYSTMPLHSYFETAKNETVGGPLQRIGGGGGKKIILAILKKHEYQNQYNNHVCCAIPNISAPSVKEGAIIKYA